jgi:hypothetical protein
MYSMIWVERGLGFTAECRVSQADEAWRWPTLHVSQHWTTHGQLPSAVFLNRWSQNRSCPYKLRTMICQSDLNCSCGPHLVIFRYYQRNYLKNRIVFRDVLLYAIVYKYTTFCWGKRWRSWLRHCSVSWKVRIDNDVLRSLGNCGRWDINPLKTKRELF